MATFHPGRSPDWRPWRRLLSGLIDLDSGDLSFWSGFFLRELQTIGV